MGIQRWGKKITSQSDNPDRYCFGHWRFDADMGDLSDGDSTVRLEPQVAKLLDYFLANQDRVISRDELMVAVWANRIVSDDAINRCISILRQTLTPEDKNAYIETVMRKGYLAHFPSAPVTESTQTQPILRHTFPLMLAVLVLGIASIFLYFEFAGKADHGSPPLRELQSERLPMVAVLPFVSVSRAGDDEFFANGMHNDLLTQLAQLQSLRVVSSTSVQGYRGLERNMRTIGEELGADVILEGSVQISANQIRINAQLIEASSDEHLWAESYDRELSPANIFKVQSEIAYAISEAMHTKLTVQDNRQLALIPTENMAAYRAYHRAMQIRVADVFAVNSPDYLQALEEAVSLDPTFSRAWAELITVLAYLNMSGDRPELMLRVEEALAHLQAIAPASADYVMAQAAYVYYVLQDFDRAHDLVSEAILISPNDTQAIQLRSWIERRQGDFDALVETRREARLLDPRNPKLTNDLLEGLLLVHRYDDAWAEIETASLDSFAVEHNRSLLLFRKHRDFNRLAESTQELCHLYAETDCGWIELIAIGDFAGALASLNWENYEIENPAFSATDLKRILTLWIMREDQLMEQKLPGWQSQLERDRNDLGGFLRDKSYVVAAMLAGMQGHADESENWIHQIHRKRPIDWSERAPERPHYCRVLGMIGAVQATIDCIRDGLEEPSAILPFFEPYLPFYDSLRDQPEFMQMLIEIDADARKNQSLPF